MERKLSTRLSTMGRSSTSRRKLKGKSLEMFRQELHIDDHMLTLEDIEIKFGTDLKTGLPVDVAEELLRLHGPNVLMPQKNRSRFGIFCEYIFGGFSTLLWMGVVMSIASYIVSYMDNPDATGYEQVYLAVILFAVITVTGTFGFYQESANVAIMESFKKLIPKHATVIRNGKTMVISSEVVVIGDLVELESGGCVPADVRIIKTSGLKVDNSSITGESDPQARSVEFTDYSPLETKNLAFYGTNIIEGSGIGVVISTGDDTLMGHIAGLTSGLKAEVTPIKRELQSFVHTITAISICIGLVFFVLTIITEQDIFKAFIYFIAIVMANVPEGLLVTMTACLTLTARKMSKKNCLVKNLHSIETLGSTSVICSDKTGTLTQNRMTVSHICYDHTIIDVLSDTYTKTASTSFDKLCRVGMLCSRADFTEDDGHLPPQVRAVVGDASESAVLKCMETIVGNVAKYRLDYPKVAEIPFNSTNKYQLSVHKMPMSERTLLVLKGAPENVIERCSKICLAGTDSDVNEQHIKKLKMATVELGYLGERVLGFAELELPEDFNSEYIFEAEALNFPTTGLTFVGFMSMIDPPRPGVPDAVSKCKSAGIKVIMVTGDHPITAMAIARKVGIISPGMETVYDISMRKHISADRVTEQEMAQCTATIVTGAQLRDMNTEELDHVVSHYEEIVFARTSPQQKLMIVEAFQRAGNIVGVTGDGVNDSPALKKADIGIAMGISGSDVSKEAADMIILDDNFASIVTGVEEGRLIFDNLKKSIAYMLTSNVPEVFPFICFVALQIPNALSIMAILLIDVGTDLWPGISLAYEKAESDIMKRPPRNQATDRLVGGKLLCFTYLNVGMTQTCAGFSCFFYTMAEHGFMPSRLLGIATSWYSEQNDLLDSFNQEWTAEERKKLDKIGVSVFFIGVVITQLADLVICKTRKLSVFNHGMKNHVMNTGMIFECGLACLTVYCPYINTIFGFEPFHLYLVIPAIPFAILIVLFDEVRKYFLRTNPGGFIERETYF